MNAPLPPDAVAVASIRTSEILPSRSNPRKRFDEAYIAELADSIKNHGLIQPITVRPIPLDSIFAFNKTKKAGDESLPPTYEIVVGECRWRAAQLAGLAEIPAFWRELDDKQVLEIQVVENLQRRDVHELEEAEGYERLMKHHGYTAAQLAAKVGKSRAYIYGRLKLTALAPKARDMFYGGQLTANTALLIARIPGSELQMKAAADITRPRYNGELMSYREAFDFIQNNYMLDLEQATFKMDDADLVKKAGSCDACPKRSGNDLMNFSEIGDPNVCTDPTCFNDKRDANYLRLKDLAEKSGREVITGKAAEDMTYGGSYSLRNHNLVKLDEKCHDDPERRTYREILGDKAPAVTMVEDARHKVFIEAVDTRQLEVALKKAGIGKPAPKESKESREAKREREEKEARAEAETTRRTGLLTAIWPKLYTMDLVTPQQTIHDLLTLLAVAWLRQDAKYVGLSELEDKLVAHIGASCQLPDEYDDDVELERLTQLINCAPVGRILALLFDTHLNQEDRVGWYNADKPAPIIDGLAGLLKVQPETAKPEKAKAAKPASTPPGAAHASAESAQPAAPAKAEKPAKKPAAKKAKAKADPAPALPANEAAAPPKATERPAWPFPTGARG